MISLFSLNLEPSLVPDSLYMDEYRPYWMSSVYCVQPVQSGWNSQKSLQSCPVKTLSTSLTYSWSQTTLVCQLARPRQALKLCYFLLSPLQLSRTISSRSFIFLLFEMFFFYPVVEYNQPTLAWSKTNSRSVLWEGILSDWSRKYKRIFKLPTRQQQKQNLLRLMLQKQWNNLTNRCVRLCWVQQHNVCALFFYVKAVLNALSQIDTNRTVLNE